MYVEEILHFKWCFFFFLYMCFSSLCGCYTWKHASFSYTDVLWPVQYVSAIIGCIIAAVSGIWTTPSVYYNMLIYDPTSQHAGGDWLIQLHLPSVQSQFIILMPTLHLCASCDRGRCVQKAASSLAEMSHGCPGEAVFDSTVSKWGRLTVIFLAWSDQQLLL